MVSQRFPYARGEGELSTGNDVRVSTRKNRRASRFFPRGRFVDPSLCPLKRGERGAERADGE